MRRPKARRRGSRRSGSGSWSCRGGGSGRGPSWPSQVAAGDKAGQRLGDRARPGQAGRQDQGVLEGQGGALGHDERHGVGGVADQHHRPPPPAFGGHLLDQGRADLGLVVQLVQQLRDGGGEAGEALAQPGQRVAVGGAGLSGLVVMSA